MGCANSEPEVSDPQRVETVTGQLRIKIQDAHLLRKTSSVFKMDPYLMLKMSGQEWKSSIVEKGGLSPHFNQQVTFWVNSCYKKWGRMLEFQVKDSGKFGDSTVGFGAVDLNPYLKAQKKNGQAANKNTNIDKTSLTAVVQAVITVQQSFRCIICHETQPAGFINAYAEFISEPAQTLSFRFRTATFVQLKDFTCKIRVTIGEEILTTKPSSDTKQMQPQWKNEILTFLIPKSLNKALVEFIESDKVIGSFELLDLKKMLAVKDKQTEQKDYLVSGPTRVGTVIFDTAVGENPNFTQVNEEYRKALPEPPKPTPNEEKKPKEEQKADKKEDNKGQKGKDKAPEPPAEKKPVDGGEKPADKPKPAEAPPEPIKTS